MNILNNFDLENVVFESDTKGNLTRMYEVGKYYKIQTKDGVKHIKYLGIFYNMEDVPLENCLYSLDGNFLYYREIDYDRLIKSTFFKTGLQKNKSVKLDKDDASLDTNPSPNDNILLILLKLLMKYRNMTENKFKNLFENASEMNNMKRLIFNGNGALSWQKFINMAEKMNTSVIIQIVDKNSEENELIASNNESDETKMKIPKL